MAIFKKRSSVFPDHTLFQRKKRMIQSWTMIKMIIGWTMIHYSNNNHSIHSIRRITVQDNQTNHSSRRFTHNFLSHPVCFFIIYRSGSGSRSGRSSGKRRQCWCCWNIFLSRYGRDSRSRRRCGRCIDFCNIKPIFFAKNPIISIIFAPWGRNSFIIIK